MGRFKEMSRKKKVIAVICGVVGLSWMLYDGYQGTQKADEWFGADATINIVRNGYLPEYPNQTVGDAVGLYFGEPEWNAYESDLAEYKGKSLVVVTGKLFYENRKVDASLEFLVDGKTEKFQLLGFKLEGEPQSYEIMQMIIRSMYSAG